MSEFQYSSPYAAERYGGTQSSSDDHLAKIAAYAEEIEERIEVISEPLRPHLPTIGRLLTVATFLEDSWRIVNEWKDQAWYLEHERSFPGGISHLFLLANVLVMTGASYGVVARYHTDFSVAALLGVIIVQSLGYGLLFDLSFFLRNLSVACGLFMVFSDSLVMDNKHFGFPSLSETSRRTYAQLTGRILLIFLFIGFLIRGEWSFARVIVSLLGFVACGMVVVGFKAKWSAAFLVILFSLFNVFVNNWWSLHEEHHQRDFLKYDFFQTLSIIGGLVLLVNMGPGDISVDKKKL